VRSGLVKIARSNPTGLVFKIVNVFCRITSPFFTVILTINHCFGLFDVDQGLAQTQLKYVGFEVVMTL
jgi:hypothetical protein